MEKIESSHPLPLRITESLHSIGETGFIMLDIYETSSSFIVEAEIPGVNPDEIEIYMSENNLIIKGIKDEKIKSSGNTNFFCMERSFGPFKRIIDIPLPININMITANYINGVLTVSIPKSVERRIKSRKITVNT